jgi:hypothetical protein
LLDPQVGRGYFTGLTHEMDHQDLNEWINQNKTSTLHIECGYDGMRIPA